MAHPFCHMELNSTDVAKSKTFYTDMFGWNIRDMDMGGGMTYSMFKPEGEGPGGGMMKHPVPVFVSEGGWSSMTITNPSTGQPIDGTTAQQAAYIQRQGQMLAQAKGIGVFQLTFTDLDLAGWPPQDSSGLLPFAFLGVVDSNFAAKPALAAWDTLRMQPLQPGH